MKKPASMWGGFFNTGGGFRPEGPVFVRQSGLVGQSHGGPEFKVAGVARPRIADLALTQKSGGRGREQHVAATWTGRLLEYRIGGASRIAA
jgi:hypothetical protein